MSKLSISLFPFDVINIRKMAVYEKPEMVTISGAWIMREICFGQQESESLRHWKEQGLTQWL
jgi:hypothetical protein